MNFPSREIFFLRIDLQFTYQLKNLIKHAKSGCILLRHQLSHYGEESGLPAKFKTAVAWQYGKFKEFALKLDAVKEADGTSLLYNSVMVMTSSISDGFSHRFEDLNCVMAGQLGGKLKTGQHLQNSVGRSNQPPIANVWLTLMRAFGLTQTSFGNSTGVISQILT